MFTRVQLAAGAGLFVLGTLLFIWLLKDGGDPDSAPGNKQPPSNVPALTESRPPEQALDAAPLPELVLESGSIDPEPGERGMSVRISGLGALQAGDAVAFRIPHENQVYQGQVREVNLTAAGNRVISGESVVEGRAYPFLFTVGSSQTFGTIQTPVDRYQMETRAGVGRIVSARSIASGLDYSRPDYVIPQLPAEPDMTDSPQNPGQ